MNDFHTPVLLQEAIDFLKVKKGSKYIDATLGGGGHSKKILELGGIVLGIDQDEDAISYVKSQPIRQTQGEKSTHSANSGREVKIWDNLTLALGNFKNIDKIARLKDFSRASGILFDLGVSSFQLENPERGFSYQKEGPLDMRMDKKLKVQAADLLNILTKGELDELFFKLGEENNSRTISDGIVRARGIKPIRTTGDLVLIIQESLGKKGRTSALKRSFIAKRIFQALRIAVNDELNSLREVLLAAYSLLDKKGRVAVISFHSLEDRIVKNAFKEFELKNMGRIITKKPIVPSLLEIERNSRSKSAKLRVFEKI